jgi:RNA polymerase sigma factor (TIGR02999 family)
MGQTAEQLTQVIEAAGAGDAQAAEELLPLVYEELRRLAAAKMAQQPPGQTLQGTALVHEVWLKLTAQEGSRWRDRQHFFRAAAEAMRQILIDRARRRLRLRHGQGQQHVGLDEVQIAAPEKDDVLVQMDEALIQLREVSPERAEIVNLRFFAGLGEAEIAGILGLSERSVQRQWCYARAWLFARIQVAKM